MFRFILASASKALLALCVLVPIAQANMIVNGSFEAKSCAGGTGGIYVHGTDLTGWTIDDTGNQSSGEYPACFHNGSVSGGAAPDGSQWLALGQKPYGDFTIQQTMTGMSPGASYSLSFAIASEVGCCSVAEVSFLSGSETAAQTFTAPGTAPGAFWQSWTTYTMDFVATSASVTLQFTDLNVEHPSGNVLGLDNVDVEFEAGAPEPGSFFLVCGAGAALLGLAALRTRVASNRTS